MSTSVELPGFQKAFETPVANPREEAVWQAWVAKGRARERRGSTTRFKVVKLVSAAMLLATAAFASNLASFDVIIRFVVALGAVVVMLQAFLRGIMPSRRCSEHWRCFTTRSHLFSVLPATGSAL